jgi:hypothetical protein
MPRFHATNSGDIPFTAEEEAAWDAREAAIISEQAKNAYRVSRQLEYPSVVDQLDILFHNGFDSWKAQIQAIKDKYPKS